ncbi:FUSC family protein [Yinghuangia seranimata]|uniref:FUSC family protein n=1 Tax=Yinghuangia seranimata TaxID=408067 RepID=UPI00248D271B|nr:FUSC family protein [Yinghuangia seranimata]MDI2126771.1 FUSC family protein [Yinghuangia seranimata]
MTEDAKPEPPAPAEQPRALPPGSAPASAPGGGTLPPFPAEHPPHIEPDHPLRPIVTLSGDRFAWANGTRAALGVGLPFALVTAVSGVADGSSAAIGGYAVLYASTEPYGRRARVLAAVGLGLAAAYAAGAVTAGRPWVGALVITIVAGTATFLCGALRVGRPGGYMFTLTCAMGTFLPAVSGHIATSVALLLVGAASAWLVSMSGWLVRPHYPEHLAIDEAFQAIAGFLDAIGTREVDAARHQASHALYDAWVTVIRADGRRSRMSGDERRLQVLVRRALDLFHAAELVAEERSDPLPPETADTVREIAAAVGRPGAVAHLPPLVVDPQTNGERRLRAALRGSVQAAASPAIPTGAPLKGDRPGVLELIETAGGGASLLPPIAVRTGLAVGAATGAAEILPVVHPSWVAIGAAAALQGGNAVLDFGSALQRAIGTFIGVAVVVVFLHDLSPGPWETVVTVALLYGAAQTVMRRNLVVGTAFITPVPLVLVGAGLPGHHVGDLASTRLLDMLLGLGIGLLTSFLLWRRASTYRLPAALGRAIRAEGLMLRTVVGGKAGDDAAAWQRTRTSVRRELISLWNVYESSLGELAGRREGVEALWPALLVVQRLGFRLMAAPLKPAVPPEEALPGDDAEELDEYVDALATAAEHKSPPVPPELPEMWGHPVLRQHLKRLTEALDDGARRPPPGIATELLAQLSEPPHRVREAEMPRTGQSR